MKATHLLVLALIAVIVHLVQSAPSPIQDATSDQGQPGETPMSVGPLEGQLEDSGEMISSEGAATQDTGQLEGTNESKESPKEGDDFYQEGQPESKPENQASEESQEVEGEAPQATTGDFTAPITEVSSSTTEAQATATGAPSVVTSERPQTSVAQISPTPIAETPQTKPAGASPPNTTEVPSTTPETPATASESRTTPAETPTTTTETPSTTTETPRANVAETPTTTTNEQSTTEQPSIEQSKTELPVTEPPTAAVEVPTTGTSPPETAEAPQIDEDLPPQEVTPRVSEAPGEGEVPSGTNRAPYESSSPDFSSPTVVDQTPEQLNQTDKAPSPHETPKGEDDSQLKTGPLLRVEQAQETSPKSDDAQNIDQGHGRNAIDTAERMKGDGGEKQKEYGQFKIDMSSCSKYANESELIQLVEMILDKLGNENCLQLTRGNLKLRPATNKQISGFIMETSSLPLDIGTLTQAQMSYVSCEAATPAGNSSEQSSSSSASLRLRFNQELEDGYLVSRWRMYKRLSQDDLPSEVFKSLGSLRGRDTKLQYSAPTSATASNKCQRFSVDSGDYYLELLAPRTSSTFEVNLDEGPLTTGGVRLVEFDVSQLYLDHSLVHRRLGASGSTLGGEFMRRQQTTQIFHNNNNHYRRNHWLQELYANWLKHEYRDQLRRLVRDDHLLVDQMNLCLAESGHKLAGPQQTAAPV